MLPETGAEAAMVLSRVHARLSHQFAPVIGRAGFDAIFQRTLKRVLVAHPELSGSTSQTLPPRMEEVEHALGTLPASVVLDFGGNVIASFCTQLAKFIGEALVLRLLRNGWPDLPEKQ